MPNTSSAAPATCPESSAARSASSSITPPRAALSTHEQDLAKFLAISRASFEPAVTHRMPIEDAVEALKIADEGRGGKVIFLPNG